MRKLQGTKDRHEYVLRTYYYYSLTRNKKSGRVRVGVNQPNRVGLKQKVNESRIGTVLTILGLVISEYRSGIKS